MNKFLPYRFLPFRFSRKGDNYLLVNDIGEHYFINVSEFLRLKNHEISSDESIYDDLKSKGFLYSNNIKDIIELQATKYRTKKRFLDDFTSLHMMVLTRRCNQKCIYCHASSLPENDNSTNDMSPLIARKCVELAFQSPSQMIKIEFQGGEPTLNFEVLKQIVEHARHINCHAKKNLEFVLCTNLKNVERKKLEYLRDNDICISTSLDGPKEYHDQCRIDLYDNGTYDNFIDNIVGAREVLGHDKVAALLTISKKNINNLNEVIDEYIIQGFGSIFLRDINPFGFVDKRKDDVCYDIDLFIDKYKSALEYIININLKGTHFVEVFTTILLTRILTPFSTGFVDLQSPAGVGISGVIYDTSGDVFVSDEARMFYAETGNKFFCLGNVNDNSWKEIFNSDKLKDIISKSCIETIPGCAWCVYQPYCGSDPVKNYKQFNDLISFKPTDNFCQKHKAVFDIIFKYIRESNDDVMDVFWSWITGSSLTQTRIPRSIEY